jgi:hypothetical protein
MILVPCLAIAIYNAGFGQDCEGDHTSSLPLDGNGSGFWRYPLYTQIADMCGATGDVRGRQNANVC